jgi:hypothetical protein
MDTNRAEQSVSPSPSGKRKFSGSKAKIGKINLNKAKGVMGNTLHSLARNIFSKMSAQKLEEKVSFGSLTSSH